MDHDNDELNPWGEELKLPMETINEIAGMLYRLADSGRCTQESPEGVFSSSSNCLATWVSRLADRIRAAQERERRAYERLHKCFWDKRTIQCIVRQMRDDADDLRHAFPNVSEELDHFADSIAKSAKNCPNSGPKIGQLDAYAPDELTKSEKVSTSRERSDDITASAQVTLCRPPNRGKRQSIDDTWEDSGNPRYPRPWTVWANDPERHVEIRDAGNIEVICISDILRSRAIGDGQMIVDAIHERDRLKKVVASVRQQVEAAKEMYRLSMGNAAKLREALTDIERQTDDGDIAFIALDALKAPARNCDCEKDSAEAAFVLEHGRPWNTEEDELATWLFAPMSAKKEGAHPCQ